MRRSLAPTARRTQAAAARAPLSTSGSSQPAAAFPSATAASPLTYPVATSSIAAAGASSSTPTPDDRPTTEGKVLSHVCKTEPSATLKRGLQPSSSVLPAAKKTKYAPLPVAHQLQNAAPNGNALYSAEDDGSSSSPLAVYSVMYRKRQNTNKKHKTWEDDGILTFKSGCGTLFEANGKVVGKSSKLTIPDSFEDEIVFIAGKEVQISHTVALAEFTSGKCFIAQSASATVTAATGTPAGRAFKPVSLSGDAASQVTQVKTPKALPRHNPHAPNAIVLPEPQLGPRDKRAIIDVYNLCNLDIMPAVHLRPHQIDGVKFLYECVMGMRHFDGHGAILADEMGLGKSLQSITLLWTLLKQSPFAGGPAAKKAIILCPATLCDNWQAEFKKWLGSERIQTLILSDKDKASDFKNGRAFSVLICGYEKFRICQEILKDASFDLLIADEGHRLKNFNSQVAQAIKAVKTPRKIFLTGTPVQFFSLCDLVNPGVLGTQQSFSKVYEEPILRSRDPNCDPDDKEIGNELARVTRLFVLRRTSESISQAHLPPKTDVVVFIKMVEAQERVYDHIVRHPLVRRMYSTSSYSSVLGHLTVLKKLVNSVNLLYGNENESFHELELNAVRPKDYHLSKTSGKLQFLFSFLSKLRKETDEKVVLVSNWTQTLDIIAEELQLRELPFLRLDGQTEVSKRQPLIDKFNKSNASEHFCFLLSAKAGGQDLDWNPAITEQAMARIWREGQKRPVKIYRLVTPGTLEEKILQRQMSKTSLSNAIVDGKEDAASRFTNEELRDLFTLNTATTSLTLESMNDDIEQGWLSYSTSNSSWELGALSDHLLVKFMESEKPELPTLVSGLMWRVRAE
ncbi:hypothetical protein DFJ73DRAFT_816282 [Zopfochytrium polystomum]|nr:hypothetical protein DFJ73DRAFT_816282 [Zopfochytrium polystomum]